MPLYRRRQIKATPGSWEMLEVLIITNEPAGRAGNIQITSAEQTSIVTTLIREGLVLGASFVAALAARRLAPALTKRLAARQQPRLRPRQTFLLPPPAKEER